MTEELQAVGRRWCQMWGNALHVLAAERPIPPEASVSAAASFPWVQISARFGACHRELRPSAIVLPQLKRSVLVCLPVIFS